MTLSLPSVWPCVDVIIPTYNSETRLSECLGSIKRQRYYGQVTVTVVDGGSTDNTIKIAKEFGALVILKNGMYGTGKNGARHYGEEITSGDFIWNVDSDNVIIEETVLQRLIEPMISDETINVSMPIIKIPDKGSGFNSWLSGLELINVNRMVTVGRQVKHGYTVIDDMSYGLTNCAVVRRSAIQKVNGYDSDVRTLSRLRNSNLSKGVIDIESHFIHYQAESLIGYLKKWDRRIRRFALMGPAELSDFFVEYPPPRRANLNLKKDTFKSILFQPLISLLHGFRDKRLFWFWGLPYFVLMLMYVAFHVKKTMYVFNRFL